MYLTLCTIFFITKLCVALLSSLLITKIVHIQRALTLQEDQKKNIKCFWTFSHYFFISTHPGMQSLHCLILRINSLESLSHLRTETFPRTSHLYDLMIICWYVDMLKRMIFWCDENEASTLATPLTSCQGHHRSTIHWFFILLSGCFI